MPIWTLKEFIEKKDLNCDLVIMSTKTDDEDILNILETYEISALKQSIYLSNYYRDNLRFSNLSDYKKAMDLLENDDDKALYEMIVKVRAGVLEINNIYNYHYNNNKNKYHNFFLLNKQYLDKINKNAVNIILDAGLNNGQNVIAYKKLLPNLQKVYGFEAIYDLVKKDYIEEFILDEKLEIVPFLLGDLAKKVLFCINKNNFAASFAEEITSKKTLHTPNFEQRVIDVTTIDKFCKDRNVKPDLIKMDIEGAELAALKAGIETIKRYRPQLAISIYHSNEEFVSIPLYLGENLQNYTYKLGHYSPSICETILYAIPKELA